MTTVSMTLDEIHALARRCLQRNGCDEENAQAVAKTVTAAERDGTVSHGLFRIPDYVRALRNGKVDGTARPRPETLTPAAIRLDGNNGFAPLTIAYGIPLLAKAADRFGIAVLLIRNSFHYAALWPEVELIAARNLVGIACTVHTPTVAPYGAKKPLFSTNPLAFAYPRPGKDPYVFDMATGAMSRGDIGLAARDGRELPPGIGLDSEGNPTTDAKNIFHGGVILPFGGYKGTVLATMIELLSAGLVGDYFSYEALEADSCNGARYGGPARGGQFIMAMSPQVLAGPDWAEHSDGFLSQLEHMDGVRLPGQRRFKNRLSDAPRDIDAALVETIEKLSAPRSG